MVCGLDSPFPICRSAGLCKVRRENMVAVPVDKPYLLSNKSGLRGFAYWDEKILCYETPLPPKVSLTCMVQNKLCPSNN